MTCQGGKVELDDVTFILREGFAKRRRRQEGFSDTNELTYLFAIERHKYTAFRELGELRRIGKPTNWSLQCLEEKDTFFDDSVDTDM
jgi:hypothetical protein